MIVLGDGLLSLQCKEESGASQPFAPNYDPTDGKVLSMARKWLSRCIKEHEHCGQGSFSPDSMPTRLLDITEKNIVRLVTTQGRTYSYMALSYCWGETNFKGTVQRSLQKYARGVKLDSLPKTIQNALQIASALGLDYCWVDALCIIQDDGDDWNKEAAKMALIYESATLTLAASSSLSSEDGLFSQRECSRYPLVPCHIAGSTLHPSRPEFGALNERKWRKRAWTLQEELVSRRILYWDLHMLYWDCQERQWYEWGNEDRTNTSDIHSRSHNQNQRVKLASHPPSIGGEREIRDPSRFFWLWDRTHLNYWERKITYPKDWPIAIRGVAEVFQKLHPGDKLVWGMWKGRFIADLLWEFVPKDVEIANRYCSAQKPHPNVPTWSWFSRLSQGEVRSSMYSDFESWGSHPKAECLEFQGIGDPLFPRQAVARLRGWLMVDWKDYVHQADHDDLYWDTFEGTCFMPLVRMMPSSGACVESKRPPQFIHEIRGLYLRPRNVAWHVGEAVWELAGSGGPANGPVLPMTAGQFAELESRPLQTISMI
ncbi:MAG: hypothetical protein FE78DRAFT_71254 [Acidomyces sp. 'richmondensis']|nr:MAG: hypothetical protein FE78DRAFT_71254 [Acidomyces sp. 'richmondensis']